jgi:hypothetical protein
MTNHGTALGEFLQSLVGDEEAAQQYLLNPEATLAADGLSRVTDAEILSAADSLGLQTGCAETISDDAADAIGDLLRCNFVDDDAYQNILSCGDLSSEFASAAGLSEEWGDDSAE